MSADTWIAVAANAVGLLALLGAAVWVRAYHKGWSEGFREAESVWKTAYFRESAERIEKLMQDAERKPEVRS